MWKSIWQYSRRWIVKYDAWCHALGLTPEQRRSCVPYRSEPAPRPVESDIQAQKQKE